MSDYDKTNTFVLFVNDKKGNEKRPDRTGTVNIEGVEYNLSGWIKQGAKGPFLSGTVQLKESQPKQEARQPSKNEAGNKSSKAGFDDFEDDIPF